MIRSLRLLLAVVAALAAACAAPPPQRQIAPAAHRPRALPRTGLQIVVAPKDGEVEIDGVRHREAIVPLAPGVHRVSVRRPGYATWRAEVSVSSRIERLEITLVKAP